MLYSHLSHLKLLMNTWMHLWYWIHYSDSYTNLICCDFNFFIMLENNYFMFQVLFLKSSAYKGIDRVIWTTQQFRNVLLSLLILEDPLEYEMTTHSSILAWEISWSEKPGGLQPMGLQSHTWLSTVYEGFGSLLFVSTIKSVFC